MVCVRHHLDLQPEQEDEYPIIENFNLGTTSLRVIRLIFQDQHKDFMDDFHFQDVRTKRNIPRDQELVNKLEGFSEEVDHKLRVYITRSKST